MILAKNGQNVNEQVYDWIDDLKLEYKTELYRAELYGSSIGYLIRLHKLPVFLEIISRFFVMVLSLTTESDEKIKLLVLRYGFTFDY